MGNFNNTGPGFDPIKNSGSLAKLEGLFLRKLFTLKLRTRNYFHLILMLVFGIGVTGFMGVALYAISIQSPGVESDFTYYLLMVPLYSIFIVIFSIGVLLLVNFLINMGIYLGLIKTTKEKIDQKRREKKMPKRRKDYK